jgi:hypothetical protein
VRKHQTRSSPSASGTDAMAKPDYIRSKIHRLDWNRWPDSRDDILELITGIKAIRDRKLRDKRQETKLRASLLEKIGNYRGGTIADFEFGFTEIDYKAYSVAATTRTSLLIKRRRKRTPKPRAAE